MKKLFCSAFAMSLSLASFESFGRTNSSIEFLGMEDQVLPELTGQQRFTPPNLHQNPDWNVSEEQVEVDKGPLKGQKHSMIPWDRIDPEKWLDFQNWLSDRQIKDQHPDWKLRLRDERQSEHVGKILQCRGSCEVYRGTDKAKVQHLSRLDEGDELRTGQDTTAWVFLMDGTLLRLGPKTSVSLQEINWSEKQVFYLVRLNQGHIFWHPRESSEYPSELGPETDAISLPLMVREANQQWFERELFQTQKEFERAAEITSLEERASSLQIKKLNELRQLTPQESLPLRRSLIVAPNVSIITEKTSFDLLYYPGGSAYVKARREGELSINLRGYSDTSSRPVTDLDWYEVNANGRNLEKVSQDNGKLEITELLTRRIRTLELARELWMEKYTLPLLPLLKSPPQLARTQGYSLWGEELEKRFQFLLEYTRRIETTNLRSLENLLTKLEASGDQFQKEINDDHYRAGLNYYLSQLKQRYLARRQQVREMNDLQYYVWILRHGKKKN